MNETRLRRSISANIAFFRKQAGYTQVSLAAAINSKQSTISSWERGQSLPDADTLLLLSELFNCSMSDLYGSETGRSDSKFSADELEVLYAYRFADPLDRALVRRALGLQEKEAAAKSSVS